MSKQNELFEILQSRLPEELTAGITGNVSAEIKEIPLKWLAIFKNKGRGYAGNVAERVKVVDVSVDPSPDHPLRMEAKVTTEIDVTPDMCSVHGVLEKGCIAFLVDECSTIAMTVISAYNDHYNPPGVSQTINIFYHSEALSGTKLRIVNRSSEYGRDSNSGRTQIWNTVNNRLIASGTQITMPPSEPPTWFQD
ncbi:hypothetical protein BDN70DRAFT_879706 [Pholiota conissans]|uniref:Uncharacterized protein n=1 Tax=Pholiota conissans TaxID=109636 RepID=A0A9P5Z050_9AGAR|nr:hypothetical protein BDN70DRAFT_879706 [Pholiota conissans]